MITITKLKQYARVLKRECYALYLASRHPLTPWYAKVFVAIVVAYAFSPIDLIPDFIPIVGYLDDLVLLPLGIKLAIKLIPYGVLEECRHRADEVNRKTIAGSKITGITIILIWVLLGLLVSKWVFKQFSI